MTAAPKVDPLTARALAAPARSRTPQKADAPARRLRALEAPSRRRRPKLVYGILALAGALAIGTAQMVLSILTTQGSYELSSLAQEQTELRYQQQILNDDLAGLNSPQFLAANATALGMVIDQAPSYLRLSDGAMLGPGQASLGGSSVDALGRGAVPNSLVADTPLVTDPDATIQGPPAPTPETGADGGATAPGVANTPPPLSDGLPTPATH